MSGAGVARGRPALPAAGLTFEVDCRTSPGDAGRPHLVTVTADWQLLTPHNLDAERVAVPGTGCGRIVGDQFGDPGRFQLRQVAQRCR